MQQELRKDQNITILAPACPGMTLLRIFLYFQVSLAQGSAHSRYFPDRTKPIQKIAYKPILLQVGSGQVYVLQKML